jgi:hypothetical protein
MENFYGRYSDFGPLGKTALHSSTRILLSYVCVLVTYKEPLQPPHAAVEPRTSSQTPPRHSRRCRDHWPATQTLQCCDGTIPSAACPLSGPSRRTPRSQGLQSPPTKAPGSCPGLQAGSSHRCWQEVENVAPLQSLAPQVPAPEQATGSGENLTAPCASAPLLSSHLGL